MDPLQQEEEHEVYGADIPQEAFMEEADEEIVPIKDESKPTGSNMTFEDAKKRLTYLNEKIRILQEEKAKVEKEIGMIQDDPSGDSFSFAMKEEIDSRSIFVSNVDYGCGPEELQEHFQNCGTINRVTIVTDSFGQPKGYAYVEFAEANAVQNALKLTETELHGRRLRVSPKRTNIPGMKQSWGPFSFGKFSRFRRGRRYGPYY